jgi:hypothetical protein
MVLGMVVLLIRDKAVGGIYTSNGENVFRQGQFNNFRIGSVAEGSGFVFLNK